MSDPANLENLHSIVLPPTQGLWPVAPGWYLIGACLVAVVITAMMRFLHQRKVNKYRQDALHEMSVLEKSFDNGDYHDLGVLPLLVKSTALKAYSRSKVASLYGEKWGNFLNETLASPQFSTHQSLLLSQISYGTPGELVDIPRDQISELCIKTRYWIRNHITENEKEKLND